MNKTSSMTAVLPTLSLTLRLCLWGLQNFYFQEGRKSNTVLPFKVNGMKKTNKKKQTGLNKLCSRKVDALLTLQPRVSRMLLCSVWNDIFLSGCRVERAARRSESEMLAWSCVKSSVAPTASRSSNRSFPARAVCLRFLTVWKELSVRLRASLPSKWIRLQSCARCKMLTLKQASIPLRTQTHTIAISF